MRYTELRIETRREAPARARTEGEALLIRAGYLDAGQRPTALGDLALARLTASARTDPERWSELGRVITTSSGATVIEAGAGGVDLLVCTNCDYADLAQTARIRKTHPIAEPLLPLERVATPDCHSIETLASFLGILESRTAKALLYVHKGTDSLVFVVVRGDRQASDAKLQSLLGELQPASIEQITAAGVVPGYASPIGLSNIEIVVDDLIPVSPNLVAGANEEGFHLRNTNYGRDFRAQAIADITLARSGDPCPECSTPMRAGPGYVVTDSSGPQGLNGLLCLAENCHDERGLRFPFGMGAFDVHVLHLPSRGGLTGPVAEELHSMLEQAGVPVLLDDREERAGVKFNDADLIGCPVRITVGERHVQERMVELKFRSDSNVELTPIDAVLDRVHSLGGITQ